MVEQLQIDSVGVVPKARSLLIVGRSGVGKSTIAVQLALARLAVNRPVVILDSGHNYLHLAQLLQGRYVDLQPNHRYHPVIGAVQEVPLWVYDFEPMWGTRGAEPAQWEQALPYLPEDLSGGLVILDESFSVLPVYPVVTTALTEWAQQGASIVVTGQSLKDVESFRPVLKNARFCHLESADSA